MADELGTGGGAGDLDELEHGVEGRPWGLGSWVAGRWDRLPRAVRAVAFALVGALVGVLVWQGMHPQASRRAAAPSPTPTPPVSLVLQAEGVCTSYSGDILQVGFRLTNVGQQPVRIVVVRPDLPMGMLLELGVDLTSAPCRSTSTRQGAAAVPADGSLAPGESQPVTFRLLPVVACAAPAPVAASVELGGNASPAVVTIPVLVDLGSVHFAGCAALTS